MCVEKAEHKHWRTLVLPYIYSLPLLLLLLVFVSTFTYWEQYSHHLKTYSRSIFRAKIEKCFMLYTYVYNMFCKNYEEVYSKQTDRIRKNERDTVRRIIWRKISFCFWRFLFSYVQPNDVRKKTQANCVIWISSLLSIHITWKLWAFFVPFGMAFFLPFSVVTCCHFSKFG